MRNDTFAACLVPTILRTPTIDVDFIDCGSTVASKTIPFRTVSPAYISRCKNSKEEK
jgi:hypothetical protein